MTQLDLRGTPCPLNFIRTKLALEKLSAGEWLQVDLDAEPEEMVTSSREADIALSRSPWRLGLCVC